MQKKTVSQEALLSMAVAGLLSGAFGAGCSHEKSEAPAAAAKQDAKPAAMALAKHACKGFNDCKGQGGCKSGDAGCASKNSCKAKGGCAVPIKH